MYVTIGCTQNKTCQIQIYIPILPMVIDQFDLL